MVLTFSIRTECVNHWAHTSDMCIRRKLNYCLRCAGTHCEAGEGKRQSKKEICSRSHSAKQILACQDSNFPSRCSPSIFGGRAPTGSLRAIAATAQGCSRGLPCIFNNARRAAGLPHPEPLGKRQLSNLEGLTVKQIVLTLTNLCPSTHLQCVFQPLSVYHATCTTLRLPLIPS